jgi:hypothetical protein
MAAAPAEPNGASIEALFRPSTRFQDSHRNHRGRLPEGWTEVELLPGLSLENIRATRILWNAFHSFARQKIVWMTPGVYVCTVRLPDVGDPLVLYLRADPGITSLCVHATPDTADGAATATCDFLLRFFATCEQHDLYITRDDIAAPAPLSGAGVSLFFEESRSCLRKVTLAMTLSEDLCLAIATMSRLDVEVNMRNCYLANDAVGAFVECLQSDRGPVTLDMCEINSQILANALAGKSRVFRFLPHFGRTDDADMAILFRALANNRGLVDLDLSGDPISDENWTILCESLEAHPTLTSLDLICTAPRNSAGEVIYVLPDEQKAFASRYDA